MRTDVTTAIADRPEPGSDEALFRAELALHEARQSHYDPWIAAAYDRLHEAIEQHLRACSR